MNNLIKFYTNTYPANNKKDYLFNDIVKKWDDYKLEIEHDYIQWLFPDNTGGVNPKAPKLSSKDIKLFKTDIVIRSNVVEATLRILFFYGFVLDKNDIVIEVKPLNRRNKGKTIGLFSPHNYKRLTRIMEFLVIINMEFLSAVVFLALCKSIKSDSALLKKVLENKSLKRWMITQNILVPYVEGYDVKNLSTNITYSDDDDIWGYSDNEGDWEEVTGSESNTKDIKQNNDYLIQCPITGLNYTGNSCYMDSTLLCIFAIPNTVIIDNILKKDLNMLKNKPRWSICDSNIDTDIKKRQNIQDELNNITNSMRNGDTTNKCSNLRGLIKKCPALQEFHGTETQDAGEFLSYLFNLFQVDVARTHRKSYGSNSLEPKPKWTLVRSYPDNDASPIIDVTSIRLKLVNDNYDITKFVKQRDDALLPPSETWIPNKKNPNVKYSRRKEVYIMKESPIIIFNLFRTYGEVVFKKPRTKKEKKDGKGQFKGIVNHNVWKQISAPETMTLNETGLNLSAIVVHTGGAHYVANIKCNGNWFWYDDNPGGKKHIIKYTGSYENMLETIPNPLTNGTLFFYTKINS
jgi:ubiquitin C-terminal hydrolase